MKLFKLFIITIVLAITWSCDEKKVNESGSKIIVDQFTDIRILQYQVPGFEQLIPKQKELLYYLYQAALSGRDIIWDQNYKHNLYIRRTLETIVSSFTGDRSTESFKNFMIFTKRVWFFSGIHHPFFSEKFMPEFSKEYFTELVNNSPDGKFPLQEGETTEDLINKLTPILFDPTIDPLRINLDPNSDLVAGSSNNYYEGLAQAEVEQYYEKFIDKNDPTPISYGLNSKLIKVNGKIKEKVWKVGGMYTEAIEQIVFWLRKAVSVAENDKQKAALEKLIEYYETGDLEKFDEYNILWVQDTLSTVDIINGFIENYGDAMGYRAAYESILSIKDVESTKRITAISNQAQWFEDNSPIMPQHKKERVKGISAKVITVVVESGMATFLPQIGVNLPNSNWIRAKHGSKSVSLGNIIDAYNNASTGGGSLEEFAFSEEEIELERKYGVIASNLDTDMHEVIGHASGKINTGVGRPQETLKNYATTLEETRADLVALYYVMDPKLIEIGVMPSLDVGKVSYVRYIRNGLMVQLRQIKLGDNMEQAHMRNRQLISRWVYEKGKPDNVIEKIVKDGKTYFAINDYKKLHELFGQLLREVQRIISEGDYEAGKNLVEAYGVKIDPELHKEVLSRYEKLNVSKQSGFIYPVLTPVEKNGKIVDVNIKYPGNFVEQMMYYADNYSFLPTYN